MILTQAKLKTVKAFKTGLKLSFFLPADTLQEDEKLIITQAQNTMGWLTFSPDKLKAEVEEVMKNRKIGVEEEKMSPSELMRGAIYQYWTKVYRGHETFDEFYKKKMDGFITHINQTVEQIEVNRIDEFYSKPKNDEKHD
jgi:hypothetical protein